MLPVSLDCPFWIAPSVFYNVYLSCVLCTLYCQFLWIVHFWLPLRYSITFICPVSCVPYVASFSGLSNFGYCLTFIYFICRIYNLHFFSSFMTYHRICMQNTRRVPLVEQELLTLPGLQIPSLVLDLLFSVQCLGELCPFSFGHCSFCPRFTSSLHYDILSIKYWLQFILWKVLLPS